jgi:hypothetical protein
MAASSLLEKLIQDTTGVAVEEEEVFRTTDGIT